MTADVRLETREAQHAVSLHFDCAPEAMGPNLERILPMILEYALSKGGDVVGPPFLRYHALMDNRFYLEAGIPLASPVEGTTEIRSTELPGGEVAVATHIGPYREIGTTHKKVRDWIRQNELETASASWDSYLDDPGEVEPAKVRTQVIYPVASDAG